MLPNSNGIVTEQEQPSLTYRMDVANERIVGKIDGIEAVKQAVYKALSTERYDYLIYSWNYGIETKDLFGRDMDYCKSELKRRIPEALTQDDRIDSVSDFEFEVDGNKLTVFFVVHSNAGSFESKASFVV